MNAMYRKSAVALAIAAVFAAPAAFAQVNAQANLGLNAQANLLLNAQANLRHDNDYRRAERHNVDTTWSDTNVNDVANWERNTSVTSNDQANWERNSSVTSNDVANWERTSSDVGSVERFYAETSTVNHDTTINYSEVGNTDVRSEVNEHEVAVSLRKDLSLSSDVNFSGDPTITGEIAIDSAAIAVIDNRQSVSGNNASNTLLENDATIDGDVASAAAGNLGFNTAAGDNNVQDNAAALSAADASFSFGMADAEVFVNQHGSGNATMNMGVNNAASLAGNAFSGAEGNIGVNVASGNNNEQKNALAASVATSAYAQSSISSNQHSTGNTVTNAGAFDEVTSTTEVTLTGAVLGSTASTGSGQYAGRGNSYQQTHFYPDTYTENGAGHANGNRFGHDDWDSEAQGAVANPYRPGIGGMAWDTDERGTLGFSELGTADLQASLTGTVTSTDFVAVYATNTAGLSDSAFSGASGNIGVNVASGTGNLQANSLSLAVAQPSVGGGGNGE